MGASAPGGLGVLPRAATGASTAAVPVMRDPLVVTALAVTVAAVAWSAVGPPAGQLLGIRLATPTLAAMIAIGQWRIGRDRRLPVSAMLFWRLLSISMIMYVGGMLGDLTAAIAVRNGAWLASASETTFYPVGAVFTFVALAIFPASVKSRAERVRIGLDVAVVSLASATFVWYFLASPRWHPADGWRSISSGLVLPALTLVVGFAVVRIAMAGARIIRRSTLMFFVLAAVSEAAVIFMDRPVATAGGRVASMFQAAGLTAVMVGVALQGRRDPSELVQAPPAWRRLFSLLPYAALTATVVLLLIVVRTQLDYRAWVVAIGMLALCAAVMARQFASLWENSRLLSANRVLAGRLGHQAYHDHLTGLVNRALFGARVSAALTRAHGGGVTVAVIFIDLDDFKVVNDSLGHQAGDELLVAVAGRLRHAVRAADTLARLGGDEFAVLVEEASDHSVPAVAQRILHALSSPFQVSEGQVRVAASVGVAIASGDGQTSVELLRNADVAMYAAKSADKGSWRLFEPQMLAHVVDRHRLRAALVVAVARGELEVVYQPIVDLRTGRPCAAEALVRWRRPDGELLLPGEFLPVAAQTGLISEIDTYVLATACREAAQWLPLESTVERFALHVNLSAQQLGRADLGVQVDQTLRANELPADHLVLEFAEAGLGRDPVTPDHLAGVARLGVRLAIDHFGTGHSSLASLRTMPVDYLKIDQSLTDELLDSRVQIPLAHAVVVLATTLGMATVVQGVETPAQAHRARALGCQYGQGYYFGRPVTAASIGSLLCAARTDAS